MLTVIEERDLLEQAFRDVCDELGCDYDNEAALIAAHELKQRAVEWRTMDLAPKEQMFLAIVDNEVRFVRWGKTSHVPIYGWILVDQGAEDCDLCEPTRWAPLPRPPA